MVCLIPAIVISASRRSLVTLSATVITTVPLPLPGVVKLDPVAPPTLLTVAVIQLTEEGITTAQAPAVPTVTE